MKQPKTTSTPKLPRYINVPIGTLKAAARDNWPILMAENLILKWRLSDTKFSEVTLHLWAHETARKIILSVCRKNGPRYRVSRLRGSVYLYLS